MEDKSSVFISPVEESKFWDNQDHWHLLDGYTEGGDPEGDPRPNSFMAYWNMIKNNELSGTELLFCIINRDDNDDDVIETMPLNRFFRKLEH